MLVATICLLVLTGLWFAIGWVIDRICDWLDGDNREDR